MYKALILLVATFGISCQAQDCPLIPDPSNLPALNPEIQTKLTQIVSLGLRTFLENVKIGKIDEENLNQPRIPIFDFFDYDVLPLDSVHLYFSNETGISDWFQGDFHFCNTTLSGLLGVTNNLRINISQRPKLLMNFELKIEDLLLGGSQDLFFDVVNFLPFLFPEFPFPPMADRFVFTSHDTFFLRLRNFSIGADFEIANMWQKFDVEKFELYISNLDLSADIENSVWNGEVMNWGEITACIELGLNAIIQNTLRPVIERLLRPMIVDLLDDCTLFNFIFGLTDCLDLPFQPAGLEISAIMTELSEFGTFSESDICPAEVPPVTQPPPLTTPPPTTDDPNNGDSGAGTLPKPFLLSLAMMYLLFKLQMH